MTVEHTLSDTIKSGSRLLVFLHDNPDPDAIAAGWILAEIAASLGVRYRIVYGGDIGRAENSAMVKLLKIPLEKLDDPKTRLRFLKSDRYGVVDTQPGVGNNSFPHTHLKCHIIIDHHPSRSEHHAMFADIRDDVGCCTTLLLEHYRAFGLIPHPKLATAAAYAIISETQDLEREATRMDQEALQFVLPYARLNILGRIRHPARTRNYYRTIACAMQQVMISRNSCVCHIGPVYSPEIVAELADFLVAMKRITWCLVTGLHNGSIVLSLRTTHRHGKAERVMKAIVKDCGRGGGHGMIAGGLIPLPEPEGYNDLLDLISNRFTRQLRRKRTDTFRPLLEK